METIIEQQNETDSRLFIADGEGFMGVQVDLDHSGEIKHKVGVFDADLEGRFEDYSTLPGSGASRDRERIARHWQRARELFPGLNEWLEEKTAEFEAALAEMES